MSSGPPPRQPLAGGDRDGKDADKQEERIQAPQGPSGRDPPVEANNNNCSQVDDDDDDLGQSGAEELPPEPKYICDYCKQACANKAGLISHVRQRHDQSFHFYECKVTCCKTGARLKTLEDVNEHFSKYHPEMSAVDRAQTDTVKKHYRYFLDESQDTKPVKEEKPGTSKQGASPSKRETDKIISSIKGAVAKAARLQVEAVVNERDSLATKLGLENEELRRQKLELASAKSEIEGLKEQLKDENVKTRQEKLLKEAALKSTQVLQRSVKDLELELRDTKNKLDKEAAGRSTADSEKLKLESELRDTKNKLNTEASARSTAVSEKLKLKEINRQQKVKLDEAEVEKVQLTNDKQGLKDELQGVKGENEKLFDYFRMTKNKRDRKRKLSKVLDEMLAKREKKGEPSDK